MKSAERKRLHVCYLVTHGFSARMVLQSQLVPELAARGARITVLCPAGIDRELERHAIPGVLEFASGNFRVNKATHGQISELRRYFREPLRDNPALWSRHLYYRNSSKGWIRRRADLFSLIHRTCYRSRIVNRLFGSLDHWLHRSRSVRKRLQQLEPDLVVSTYPVSAFETSCLIEAQRLGQRTVGHLLSWDNITCKGRFVVIPDDFVSWGPIMSEELQEHYQVSTSRIHECGVPHFDGHLRLVDPAYLSSVLAELGLSPDRPFLLFGMSSPIFAPREIEIVEWLAGEVRANRWGPQLQLVVRPHPQNVTGHFADPSWLPRLEALRGPRVGLNMPLLAEGKLAWNMQDEDLKVLVNLLGGCALSINSGSTLSIDALMHNKRVLLTFFDAAEQLPWWQSARRIAEFPHYAKLLATGGVLPTFSLDELAREIARGLADPDAGHRERQQAIARECGPADGKSAGRVAEALFRIAGVASHRAAPARLAH